MNRVMREVFPTLCSPRKTSLNLRRGFPNSLEFDMIDGSLVRSTVRKREKYFRISPASKPVKFFIELSNGGQILTLYDYRGSLYVFQRLNVDGTDAKRVKKENESAEAFFFSFDLTDSS